MNHARAPKGTLLKHALRDGAFVDALDDAMLNGEQIDFSHFDFEGFTESLERRGYAIVETKRTSEARMQATATDVVAALDLHGDKLVRHEAIGVLGFVVGTMASVWGGEPEVVGKAAAVAKAVVMNRRATNGEPWRQIGLLPGQTVDRGPRREPGPTRGDLGGRYPGGPAPHAGPLRPRHHPDRCREDGGRGVMWDPPTTVEEELHQARFPSTSNETSWRSCGSSGPTAATGSSAVSPNAPTSLYGRQDRGPEITDPDAGTAGQAEGGRAAGGGMIVDHWNDKTDVDARLADIKRRFEDDCPDAERVVKIELRAPPGFSRWLNEHPRIAPVLEDHNKRKIRAGDLSVRPYYLMLCDNVRVVVRPTIINDATSLIAILDTDREIKVATIGYP